MPFALSPGYSSHLMSELVKTIHRGRSATMPVISIQAFGYGWSIFGDLDNLPSLQFHGFEVRRRHRLLLSCRVINLPIEPESFSRHAFLQLFSGERR